LSIQDEYLQQALKEAPDRDVAPSDAVRQKVFAHAQATVQPKINWLGRWFSSWGHLQLVGMGTVASLVIVMLMVYPQAPDESVWSDAEKADIALSEQADLEVAEPAGNIKQQSLEESLAPHERELEQSVASKVLTKQEASSTGVAKPKAKTLESKRIEKRSNRSKKNVKPDPVTMPAEHFVDDAEAKAVDEQVLAEADAVDEVAAQPAPPSVASVSPNQIDDKGVGSLSRQQSALAAPQMSGEQLARQDIAAGKVRILYAASKSPENKPMVDEETGLGVELSSMPEKEVAIYNEVVRKWLHENPLAE